VGKIFPELLQGHPKGVSRKYAATMVVAKGPAIRDAQKQISERIVGLLGIKLWCPPGIRTISTIGDLR